MRYMIRNGVPWRRQRFEDLAVGQPHDPRRRPAASWRWPYEASHVPRAPFPRDLDIVGDRADGRPRVSQAQWDAYHCDGVESFQEDKRGK